ncbi:Mitochondrial intermediate peptidase [Coemansia biformis]|uniref:mitochondrial intermediate peptidase n=1 Tax=Coemansia biformis TaxID=1286918 RepID=A0A9W7YJ73_9FUNG|nr:Mitochondrial intermediate peptidase [Coemansia biformis]
MPLLGFRGLHASRALLRRCHRGPPSCAGPSAHSRLLARRGLRTAVPAGAHEVTREEEVLLRDVFDLPTTTTLGSAWFRQGRPTGLLMESRFVSPKSFRLAGRQAVAEAEELVQRVLAAQTADEKHSVVKCLDQLSDALCRVMDVAELVRQVHPDSSWQAAAEDVFSEMLEYMNGLNTHVGLYAKLVEVMDDPQISATFGPVEREVALSFRRDFERSGIHLPATTHARFVELSSSIHDYSREFLRCQSLPPASGSVAIPIEKLRSLPSEVLVNILQSSASHKRSDGTTVVDVIPDDYTAQYILRDCPDEHVREKVYRAWQSGAPTAVDRLERLLEDRLELSQTVGYASFADMTLDDKMARSPGHVDEFLCGLAAQARPQWDALAFSLHRTRSRARAATENMFPWDRDYWVGQQQMETGALPSLAPYFSLGRVVLGLSRVFQRLYGVELRAATPQPGEIWHPDVRKLEVVGEDGRLLGLVYCDVFGRSSKAHVGAAHFTARCARRVDDDIASAAGSRRERVSEQTVVERNGHLFQLPVVVLICNFPGPEPGAPPLLSWSNVETIFHEMGHAMHSMLGQNGFHNVAGTRCAVDFVELPSILMEHFARSPRVLALFASHYKTGAPLPSGLIRQCAERRQQYAALDLHAQLFMAALDQRYHSAAVAGSHGGLQRSPGWTTRALAEVHSSQMFGSGASRSLFGHVEGTQWQARFTHLVGYGASYYAYLFDRVLVGQIWDRVFQGDRPHHAAAIADGPAGPLDRDAGERLKNEVLRWGGGRSPWECLASVLDNGTTPHHEIEAIAQGSRSAMRTVGGWRLPDM